MKDTIDTLITDIETWLKKIDDAMPKLKTEIEKRIAELKIKKEDIAKQMNKEKSYVSVSLKRHEISPENLIKIGREVQKWSIKAENLPVANAE